MRIAVVEDNPINLRMLSGVLATLRGVEVSGFDDPLAALAQARGGAVFDLWLVDYQMPGLDGVKLIERLRETRASAHVPIVMITADGDRALRLAAVGAGATDFLTKPVDPGELKLRAGNLLALQRAQNALADRAAGLAEEVAAATREVVEREEEIVTRLALAIELRDGQTGEHILRVSEVSRLIADDLGLSAESCRNIMLASRLHDAGKLGVSDAILLKRGRLTPDEVAAMQRHTLIGAGILRDGANQLIRLAHDIALCHHERWDGAGYPNRLAGEAIPLAARIVSVADVLDALRSARPYKVGWSAEAARAEIEAQAGRAFDPACVAALMRVWDRTLPLYDAAAGSGLAGPGLIAPDLSASGLPVAASPRERPHAMPADIGSAPSDLAQESRSCPSPDAA